MNEVGPMAEFRLVCGAQDLCEFVSCVRLLRLSFNKRGISGSLLTLSVFQIPVRLDRRTQETDDIYLHFVK